MAKKGIDMFHLVWIVITAIVLILLMGQVYKRVLLSTGSDQQPVQINSN